ncbi:MAG: cation:proton antiporter [Candidatus Izemoplasmatales bacterium]
MNYSVLLYTALIIATGLLFGKIAKYFKFPNVTGYLIGGLLIGPSIFNFVKEEALPGMEIVSVVALGFIAFTIGNELKFKYFKKVGVKPVVIAFMEATLAVVFVFIGLIIYFLIINQLNVQNIRFALVLSAIAAATAPAATLMVIRQYRARGPLTETLLSVVAIDDSVAVLLFGIFVAIANALDPTRESGTLFMQIMHPILEILISLGIGAVIGLVLVFGCIWFTGRGNRISLTVAAIILSVYLSYLLGASSILSGMVLGLVFTNFSSQQEKVNELIYFFTPPIYVMFFVLSGVELKLSVLAGVGVLGILYVIIRVIGKIAGAYLGARITHSDMNTRKYLGFALIPQAGVAIGLSLVATTALNPELGAQIRAIVLSATVIYELTGPLVTKIVLKKAGEIPASL